MLQREISVEKRVCSQKLRFVENLELPEKPETTVFRRHHVATMAPKRGGRILVIFLAIFEFLENLENTFRCRNVS